MDDGSRVLQWAQQNGYTLTWLADKLGYSRQRLSVALHQNDMSLALCKALSEQFDIRITPFRKVRWDNHGQRKKSVRERGRTPGAGRGVRQSKLDPHVEAITGLLAKGASYREVVKRYGTTPSNLHDWLKKRGSSRALLDHPKAQYVEDGGVPVYGSPASVLHRPKLVGCM